MLVLSRKKNEALIIAGGAVKVTVVEIRGDKVKLGIDAPEDIDVNREEIWVEKQKELDSQAQKAE